MASVRVDGLEAGRCGPGLLLLVGVHHDDETTNAVKLADKIANLRIFNDHEGKMNLSLLDYPAPHGFENGVLAVSNFTVFGDASKSRRPSFGQSAPYEKGQSLFDHFVKTLRETKIEVQTGVFGANMQVALINDGPVTVIVDA